MKNVLIFFILFSSFSYAQIKSVKKWEEEFNLKIKKNYSHALELSNSNDSRNFYDLAYYIDAYVCMYKATNNQMYLDEAIILIKNMIITSKKSFSIDKSLHKDQFYGWASFITPQKKNYGKEFPLYESFCWRYVTDLLLIIKLEELYLNPKYKKDYNNILSFTQENIYNKWSSRGIKNLYRSNVHMMSHWVKISMNLYLITKDQKYSGIIKDFLNYFRNNLIEDDDYLVWKVNFAKKDNLIQDVSHGNAVIGVLIDLHENNFNFSKKDVDKLINLFNNKIWLNNKTFSKYIDGSGNGSGWFTDGFIKLGRFDIDLQKRIERHNKGRSVQFFANGALNAKILLKNEGLH